MPPFKEKVSDKTDNLIHPRKSERGKSNKSQKKLRNRLVEFYLPHGYKELVADKKQSKRLVHEIESKINRSCGDISVTAIAMNNEAETSQGHPSQQQQQGDNSRGNVLGTNNIPFNQFRFQSTPPPPPPPANNQPVNQQANQQPQQQTTQAIFNINVKPVKELVLDGNLSENWRRFKQAFDIFMTASKLTHDSEEVKVSTFLNAIGEDALEVYNTFRLTAEQQRNYTTVVKSFEDFCRPKKNIVYERFVFYSRNQHPGEPFDVFLMEIKRLVRTCEFREGEEEMLRDRIVLGVEDKKLQERLLQESNLDYQTAINKCRSSEIAKQQIGTLKKSSSAVHEVQQKFKGKPSNSGNYTNKPNTYKSDRNVEKSKVNQNSTNQTNRNSKKNCKFCNLIHKPRECPAYGKACNNCSRPNHFAIVCRLRNVREIETGNDTGSENSFSILALNNIQKRESGDRGSDKGWFEWLRINNQFIKFKLDSGADANILPMDVWNTIEGKSRLEKTSTILQAFGGQKIVPKGVCSFTCYWRNEISTEKFVIVDGSSVPILGLDTCTKLKIIAKVNTIKSNRNDDSITQEGVLAKYPDLFEGIGKFPQQYKIELCEGSKPVAKPPRRIPLKIVDRVKLELARLEEAGIISKVVECRDWVSNLVVVEKKNGDLRICLDPKELNDCIKDEPHLMPTLDEISAALNDAKVFSVLDLKDGFWHTELDSESRKICTFSTPYGLYEYNRMPFGIKTGPQIFQKMISQNFNDLPGIISYMDDLLVHGRNKEEHDIHLKNVLQRARDRNIRFNKSKSQINVKEVKYLGHIFSEDGIRSDENRIRAIEKMGYPVNKKDLQKFLGVVNYMRSFIPNLAEHTAPLRELLRKNVSFMWLDVHSSAVDKIKSLIMNTPMLKSFDPSLDIVIQTDASQNGLGCCLMQNNQPISYASRRLTECEQRYAPIEKELLAIIFALTKFHYYVYGRSVLVLSDHKPLRSIMLKNIDKIPNSKLQRMRIKLLNHDVKVEYLPGKYMHIADYLSRYFENTGDEEEDKSITEAVLTINVTKERISLFQNETENDVVLKDIKQLTLKGWPNDKSKLNPNVRFYHKYRNDILLEDGILFYEDRIMVPLSMRQDILDQIHGAHVGIEKMKKRAKEMVYWQGINKAIETVAATCHLCQTFQNQKCKEPMISHPIPSLPFQKVGCDLLDFAGRSYLVLMDYHSKWIELKRISNKTSKEIILTWLEIFASWGFPKTIIADNVPFNSYECRSFAQKYDIIIETSSPLYPKSNGLAETAVRIAKNILKKSQTPEEVYLGLLDYRSTPVKDMTLSPAQLIQNRRIRTKLPGHDKLFEPTINNGLGQEFDKKQLNASKQYNKTAKESVRFRLGDHVFVRDKKQWVSGQIVREWHTPRSFIIQTDSGEYRRNSSDIRNRTSPATFRITQPRPQTEHRTTRSGKKY